MAYNATWMGSPNFQQGRQMPIDHITVHHAAGFRLSDVDATFANPARQASSHFAVQGSTIHQYVDLSNTAWTDGNWYSNNSGITIEMVNDGGDPDWHIPDDTIATTVWLCKQLVRDFNLGKLYYNGGNGTLYRHCDMQPTACPGPYFKSITQQFCDRVNAISEATAPPVKTEVKPLSPSVPATPPVGSVARLFSDEVYTIDEIKEVNGIWQIRCNELCPSGFDWTENGIPVDVVDFEDGDGQVYNGTQHKFSFRHLYGDGNDAVLGASYNGSGGQAWRYMSQSGDAENFWWVRADRLKNT